MPYIPQQDRYSIDTVLDWPTQMTPGHLNYILTRICRSYVEGHTHPGYIALNELIGVLECVKQEFYRRAVVPFEQQKREANGDVYE